MRRASKRDVSRGAARAVGGASRPAKVAAAGIGHDQSKESGRPKEKKKEGG